MADIKLTSRHPLAEAAVHGIEMPGKNHLMLMDGMSVYSVLAYRQHQQEVANALQGMDTATVRRVGPGEWLLVGADPAGILDRNLALIVDQSHGRAVFRLSGPDAIRLLMKGVAVDLAGDGLPVGASANMAFGHLTISLARKGAEDFEIIGMRSFAESLFHDLKVAGREFGLSFSVSDV